ncbi:hypothetical protein AB3X96_13305 [Paraburkholderia sp. BR13439]|uniref:hypothetical protein n=1 Tax=Paraburkholderia TaxID=1822464 RepID=UPI0034CD79DD
MELAAAAETDEALCYLGLASYNEEMNAEALTYMRQTLDYPLHAPLSMSPLAPLADAKDLPIGGETPPTSAVIPHVASRAAFESTTTVRNVVSASE